MSLSGCSKNAAGDADAVPESGATDALPETTQDGAVPSDGFDLLGLIIDDDGSDAALMTMYGFLNTAENLSLAAKIYRATPGDEAERAAREAGEDGVDALLVLSENGENDSAIAIASGLGMYVVAPYYESTASGLNANIVADSSEYIEELARGIAERMTERSLKSGKILIYGRDTSAMLESFRTAIEEYYPQYIVVDFTRTTEDDESATAELADYLLYNRDIKGLYVLDSDSSAVAVDARAQAQRRLRNEGAPSPSPTLEPGATPDPLATPDPYPTYTANPGILTQISVTLFCNGLGDSNYALFEDNNIYALCIEPYYEAAAQATMALDALLRGESVSSVSRVNRPIVYTETADKYKAIYDQMKVMFSIETN